MSAEITEEQTRRIAALARLALSDEEIARYRGQLSRVLKHAAELDALDVSGASETAYGFARANALRDDAPEAFARADALRANAPAFARDHFRVPKVVE